MVSSKKMLVNIYISTKSRKKNLPSNENERQLGLQFDLEMETFKYLVKSGA